MMALSALRAAACLVSISRVTQSTHAGPATGTIGTVRRIYVKAQRIRSDVGLAGVLVRTLQRLPDQLLHTQWYAVLESHPRPADRRAAIPEVETLRWAGPEDAAALATLTRSESVIRERLARGDMAILTEVGDRIVAHVFFRQGEYDESNIQFTIADDERWVYDGYVAEDMRGRRTHPRLVQCGVDRLGDRGLVRAVSTIDHLNRSSLRASAARGARQIGSVLSLEVAGVTLSSVRWVGERRRWRLHRAPRRVSPPGSAPGG